MGCLPASLTLPCVGCLSEATVWDQLGRCCCQAERTRRAKKTKKSTQMWSKSSSGWIQVNVCVNLSPKVHECVWESCLTTFNYIPRKTSSLLILCGFSNAFVRSVTADGLAGVTLCKYSSRLFKQTCLSCSFPSPAPHAEGFHSICLRSQNSPVRAAFRPRKHSNIVFLMHTAVAEEKAQIKRKYFQLFFKLLNVLFFQVKHLLYLHFTLKY